MKKSLTMSALAVIAAVGLAACVKQVWQIRYSVAGNAYTDSETVVTAPDGNIYIVGTTRPAQASSAGDGVFVAGFNPDGALLWQQVIPGNGNVMTRLASGKVLTVDDQDNVYLAWGDLDQDQVTLYKFDSQGTLADSWTAASTAYAWADELALGPDHNLYLSIGSGSVVQSFSTTGELLWQKAPDPQVGGDRVLGDYPSQNTANAVTGMGGTFDFFSDGRILLSTNNRLYVLDANGAVVSTVYAPDLNEAGFSRALVVDGNVWVIGIQDQETSLLRLDGTLNPIDTLPVGTATSLVLLAHAGNAVCMATGSAYLEGSAGSYRVNQFNPDGGMLAQTDIPVAPGYYWQVGNLVGDASGCYVSEWFGAAADNLVSRIRHIDTSGKDTNLIVLKDYGVGDFVVEGDNLIQVGLAGPYDNSSSEVLLAKHLYY